MGDNVPNGRSLTLVGDSEVLDQVFRLLEEPLNCPTTIPCTVRVSMMTQIEKCSVGTSTMAALVVHKGRMIIVGGQAKCGKLPF